VRLGTNIFSSVLIQKKVQRQRRGMPGFAVDLAGMLLGLALK
jgi:hypothetical protein